MGYTGIAFYFPSTLKSTAVVDAILDCLLFSQQLQVLDIIQALEELSKEFYRSTLSHRVLFLNPGKVL